MTERNEWREFLDDWRAMMAELEAGPPTAATSTRLLVITTGMVEHLGAGTTESDREWLATFQGIRDALNRHEWRTVAVRMRSVWDRWAKEYRMPSNPMGPRMFAPGVEFMKPAAAPEQLAAHLREYVKTWLPADKQPAVSVDEGKATVYFPMTGEEFVAWGALLMEDLHDACRGTTADEGNEFLCCFSDYAPGQSGIPAEDAEEHTGPAPADRIHAILLLSDDGGMTWLARNNLIGPGEHQKAG